MDHLDLFRRLVRARDDDPAWADLLELCRSQVRRTLWFRNWMPRENSRAFVADLAQEVLIRLVAVNRRRMDRLVALGSIALQMYLRRMVENAVCDQLRADMVRIKLEDALAFDDLSPHLDEPLHQALATNTEENPDSDLSAREIREVVERALRAVAPPGPERSFYRQLFQLYFVEGRSTPQIARMPTVPLSPSGVRRRIAHLREILQAAFDGEPLHGRVVERARSRARAAARHQPRRGGRDRRR